MSDPPGLYWRPTTINAELAEPAEKTGLFCEFCGFCVECRNAKDFDDTPHAARRCPFLFVESVVRFRAIRDDIFDVCRRYERLCCPWRQFMKRSQVLAAVLFLGLSLTAKI